MIATSALAQLSFGLGCLSFVVLPATACDRAPIALAPPALAAMHSRQPAQPGDVVINEILAHTDPPQVDTIELFNPTDASVAIGGWFLSDNGDELDRYQFPPNTTIPAQGYHLVTGDEVSFGLSEFGETVFLYAPDAEGNPGVRIDQVRFGVSPNGISFGRHENSTGAIQYPLQRALTFGAANAGPLVSPLTIVEILYHPTIGSEYVILANRGTVNVPLFDPLHPGNTWQLAVDDKVAFVFPPNTWLAPGSRLVIAAVTPITLRQEYIVPVGLDVVGPFAGKLSNEGERVALWAPQPPERDDGTVAYAELDGVTYGFSSPWPSSAAGNGAALQRIAPAGYADDPSSWQAGQPTLGPPRKLFLPTVRN